MAKAIATIEGTALVPGISKNGRRYSKEAIAKAVARLSERIASGADPAVMLTSHSADDDSRRIVGRLVSVSLAEDGSARFAAQIADTDEGRKIAALVDTRHGPAFLKGVSIRGAWVGKVRREIGPDGSAYEEAPDLEIDGLDFTRKPGVPGAQIDTFTPLGPGMAVETASDGRVPITESVEQALVTAIVEEGPEATVTAVIDEAAQALKSGKPAAPQTKAKTYADPGYQPDKAKRYALDSRSEAKAAWSYIHQAKNAKNYTTAQLKRIKQRIKAALKRFGVEVSADEGWIIDRLGQVTESQQLAEHYMGDEYDAKGSFCISLSNGPINLTISSYCVDPADLDVIGRAAMTGAVACLASIDPDMDGDMDVPGADAEDTDGDLADSAPSGEEMESAAPAPVTEAEPSAPQAAPEPPAADPAPGTATEETEPVMAEPTTPAVESSPAAAAPATAGVHLTDEQFQALLARLNPTPAPAAVAPAPVAVEAAPAAPAPVTETEDQRIARLVAEGIANERTRLVQEMVENGYGPARKGLVRPVNENTAGAPAAGVTDMGIPEDWPQKPLHQYTREERARYLEPRVVNTFLGDRAKD